MKFLCAIGLHIWKYDRHNPYRRTCRICGTRQSFYVPSWDFWYFNDKGEIETDAQGRSLCRPHNNRGGWWE